MTGAEIKLHFEQLIDKSFSSYYDDFKMNRLFKNTLIQCCEKKYMGLDTQKEYDEIRSMLTSEVVLTPFRGNILRVDANQIVNAIIVLPGTPVIVSVYRPHLLQTGDTINISGVQGFVPAINGAQIVTVLTPFSFTIPATAGTTGTWVPGTGVINPDVPAYGHLFAIKTKFREVVKGYTITGTDATAPATLRISGRGNVRTGELLNFSGVADPSLNGDFYVRVVNSRKWELFTDAALSIAVPAGQGSVTAGGVINRYFYEYAIPFLPDRKIDILGQANVREPGYLITDNTIKLYPLNTTALEATLDYFMFPTKFIDVTDTLFDLETVYPIKYLFHIINESVKIYAGPSRDQYLNQDMSVKIIQNP